MGLSYSNASLTAGAVLLLSLSLGSCASSDSPLMDSRAEATTPEQLVEVVFVVGTYTCLAMAFRSFGLQLDADLDDVVPAMPPPPDSP